jgi:hypothetical protein
VDDSANAANQPDSFPATQQLIYTEDLSAGIPKETGERYGFLEDVYNNPTPAVPITKSSFVIGRHSVSDLVLNNNCVSQSQAL